MTQEIVAGRNAVFEALASGRSVNKIYVRTGTQGGSMVKIIAAAKELNVPIEYVQGDKLDKLAPEIRHQGLLHWWLRFRSVCWKMYWIKPTLREKNRSFCCLTSFRIRRMWVR